MLARLAELMHPARPILLDLADRADLRETARDWAHRIDIHTATTNHRPADALLIRPDAHIDWAATINEPTDTAALIVFLASGRVANMSGSDLVIDGGMLKTV